MWQNFWLQPIQWKEWGILVLVSKSTNSMPPPWDQDWSGTQREKLSRLRAGGLHRPDTIDLVRAYPLCGYNLIEKIAFAFFCRKNTVLLSSSSYVFLVQGSLMKWGKLTGEMWWMPKRANFFPSPSHDTSPSITEEETRKKVFPSYSQLKRRQRARKEFPSPQISFKFTLFLTFRFGREGIFLKGLFFQVKVTMNLWKGWK